jgi:NAD(P)H-hydrate repair Nnr-like enzyme with NAD(P)H-hydrate dehydratase domain
MWLLIATMLVMGHHYKVHAELFDTQRGCEDRKAYVLEVAQKYNAVIVVTCQTDA